MKAKRGLAMLLSVVMIISMVSLPAFAAEDAEDTTPSAAPAFGDVAADHWSAAAIGRWSELGIVNGDENGNFNPNVSLSRAELAQVFVNMFGLTEKAENTYSDLTGDEWYADAILKCTAAGIIKGDGTSANATALITRQETVVMFGRAMGVTPDADPDMGDFSDAATVADWAAGYMAPLAEMGIISGSGDGAIMPAVNIDRASTMALLDKAIVEYVNAPGEVSVDNANGFVVVNVAAKEGEVVLSGDAAGVVVSAGTAEGKVVAKDLTADSVKVDGTAAVSVEGKSTVGTVAVNAAAPVEIAKGVKAESVAVNGQDAKLTVAGTVGSVTVAETAANTEVKTESGAKIDSVENAAEGLAVTGKGSVGTVSTTTEAKVSTPNTVTTQTETKVDEAGNTVTTETKTTNNTNGKPGKVETTTTTTTPEGETDTKTETERPNNGGSGSSSNEPTVDTYAVTIADAENGTVVVKNKDTVINSGDKVEKDTELTVEVTPAANYELDTLKANDTDIKTAMKFTVTAATTVTATFKAVPPAVTTYAVTIADTENGNVVLKNKDTVINSGDKVEKDTELTVEVTPAANYELDTLKANDTDIKTAMKFTVTAATTVTATFKAVPPAVTTYTVTYNGNGSTGGTVPTDTAEYTEGATVTVLGNTGGLVRTDHTFAGWNTKADGNGTNYAEAATFTITANTDLYAKWNENPVNIPVASVTLAPKTLALTVGGATGTLAATVLPENATNKAFTWTSSDKAIATVADGVVTAVKAGTATITVTTADGSKTDTCAVTVAPSIEDQKTAAKKALDDEIASKLPGVNEKIKNYAEMAFTPADGSVVVSVKDADRDLLSVKTDVLNAVIGIVQAYNNGEVKTLKIGSQDTITLGDDDADVQIAAAVKLQLEMGGQDTLGDLVGKELPMELSCTTAADVNYSANYNMTFEITEAAVQKRVSAVLGTIHMDSYATQALNGTTLNITVTDGTTNVSKVFTDIGQSLVDGLKGCGAWLNTVTCNGATLEIEDLNDARVLAAFVKEALNGVHGNTTLTDFVDGGRTVTVTANAANGVTVTYDVIFAIEA